MEDVLRVRRRESAAADLTLRDVTLRDGLQDEAPIAFDAKLAVFEALASAGVRDLELTSFVRPDVVPALADAEQFARATHAWSGITRWALVLNARGAERALAAGVHHLQFVVSASDAHNQANAGRTVSQSLDNLREIVAMAGASAVVEGTVACAFGCPYSGPIAADASLQVVERVLETGVVGVTVADTIGTAAPSEVSGLVAAVVQRAEGISVGGHFHDTRGLALANALAAVDAGVMRLDASLGGLGGCPFAPGASGNLALEDLVHALEAEGIPTQLDLRRLLDAASLACHFVGRDVTSHVGLAGPRFSSLDATRR